ncbi:hypothetical protein FJZ48_01305 [Candidatus Uhrbacteria bacterium]|nr:hypothetical protein [Candidatus Uhrbacteria bacterium]
MIRKNVHRPLHREVMWDAFRMAWHNKTLWIFALFAGILQTAGIYDVLLSSVRQMSYQIQTASPDWVARFGSGGVFHSLAIFFTTPGGLNQLFVGGFLVLCMVVCSIIGQGALVAGIGLRARGRNAGFVSCLTFGLRYAVPVIGLNIVSLGLIWIARAFVFVPLLYAIRGPGVWNILGLLVGCILFAIVTILLTSIHLFGLQAIVLQGATFAEALLKSIRLFERAWLIILEKALLLLLLGIGILLLALVLFLFISIPAMLLLVFALLTQTPVLAAAGAWIIKALFFVVMIPAGAFAITFQYGAWNGIYRRLAEGRVLAKLHRWSKWLMEEFHLFHHARS